MLDNHQPSQGLSSVINYGNFRNQKGFTLIELLATLAISTLFMGLIGSTIYFGLNTYNKTVAENQLRDEANFYVSRILREIYEFSPDYIENLENQNGIKAAKFQSIQMSNNGLVRSSKGEEAAEVLEIRINPIQNSNHYEIEMVGPYSPQDGPTADDYKVIQSSPNITLSNSESGLSPTINATFSEIEKQDDYHESGTIEINFYLTNQSIGPHEMKSSFGF